MFDLMLMNFDVFQSVNQEFSHSLAGFMIQYLLNVVCL